MKQTHKVRIKIADRKGGSKAVLESGRISLPKRLLTFLFGDFCEVLVLTPGETVQNVEIEEMRGDCDE